MKSKVGIIGRGNVGSALARGDLVEGAPFGFHPHVGGP